MGRKISGGRKKLEEDEEDALRDPFLEQSLKIPQDFISEMKEAFRYFDKVKHSGQILRAQPLAQSGSGFLSAKEMPALLRALGWNPTETEVRDTYLIILLSPLWLIKFLVRPSPKPK